MKIPGYLLFALFIISFTGCDKSKPVPQHPNVILMVLDTLRADHLGVYGYGRDTSPELDTFARENKYFEYAVTAAPWTPASLATMFTGLEPISHGMMPPNDRSEAKENSARLHPNFDTIAELFGAHGYNTVGVTPNPWITKSFGYDQGFKAYHFLLRAPADVITSNAIEALDSLKDSKQPFFLYLHYLDPHDPYDPPGEFATMYPGALPGAFSYSEKMAKFIGLYDGEIRFMDREVGRFFKYLKERKLWENLALIVLGDHGEQFMERGDHSHGFKLYNEELRVPLMVKAPAAYEVKGKFKETVSTVDVFPTLLEFGQIPFSQPLPGLSLLNDKALMARKSVFSEIRRKYSQKSVITLDGKKLIMEVPLAEDSAELAVSLERWKNPSLVGIFDMKSDPSERTVLDDSALYATMREDLETHMQAAVKRRVTGENVPAEVSDETLDQLKSLGYLQ